MKQHPKISGVYDVELIRRQLDQGFLQGDALLTLRWLLNEYDKLNNMLFEIGEDAFERDLAI